MNLKKTLATGLVVAGIGGFVASVDLMSRSASSFQAINKEYHIGEVVRIENDMENNPNFEAEFPGHIQDYKMLISAEGYEEAREEYSSSRTNASFGFFAMVLSMSLTGGTYKWRKSIKSNSEPHTKHSQ